MEQRKMAILDRISENRGKEAKKATVCLLKRTVSPDDEEFIKALMEKVNWPAEADDTFPRGLAKVVEENFEPVIVSGFALDGLKDSRTPVKVQDGLLKLICYYIKKEGVDKQQISEVLNVVEGTLKREGYDEALADLKKVSFQFITKLPIQITVESFERLACHPAPEPKLRIIKYIQKRKEAEETRHENCKVEEFQSMLFRLFVDEEPEVKKQTLEILNMVLSGWDEDLAWSYQPKLIELAGNQSENLAVRELALLALGNIMVPLMSLVKNYEGHLEHLEEKGATPVKGLLDIEEEFNKALEIWQVRETALEKLIEDPDLRIAEVAALQLDEGPPRPRYTKSSAQKAIAKFQELKQRFTNLQSVKIKPVLKSEEEEETDGEPEELERVQEVEQGLGNLNDAIKRTRLIN